MKRAFLVFAAFSLAAAADECKGLKSAHCRCKLEVGPHMTTGSPDSILTPPGLEGQELLTYTLPGKCFNQQADALDYRWNKGCWKSCRDAYGVDGATPDQGLRALIGQAGKKLRAAGYCGGWVSAPSYFAAGTNKYRSNTAAGIGVGIGGTVVVQNGQKVCK